jgi:serine/threonine protein kinase
MRSNSERLIDTVVDSELSNGVPNPIVQQVQQWIDHPSWDTQAPTDVGDDDIHVCIALFSAPASDCSMRSGDRSRSIDDDDQDEDEKAEHSEPEEDDLERVESFDRFSFERILGAGGFGIVLCVFDRVLNRHVALKIQRPSLRYSRILQRRFLREVQVAASLEHPGILGVLETGRIGGHPYILSEVVDGPDLSCYLRTQQGRIPHSHSVALLRQVAEALQYAHERGVLHRDLKPSNILLEPTSSKTPNHLPFIPKLTDFGLAKRVNHQADLQENLSAGCQLMGTLRYMSPEQAAGKIRDVGIASDVYSLGAILYQCVTGKTPYQGVSSAEILSKILSEPIVPPRRIDSSLSRDLENIILKCLSREPRDRYASAGELAAELTRLEAGEPILARRASLFRRLRYWARQNRELALMATLSAAMITGTMITVSILYLRERKAVSLALSAIHESFAKVADEVLDDVPNMTEKRYQLYLLQIEKLKKFNTEFGLDARNRYALSIAYSRAGTAAGRTGRQAESRMHREECLKLLEELLKADPDNLEYQYDAFFNRKNIATELFGPVSYLDERLALKEAVHRDGLRLLALAPNNRDYRDAVASCKYDLAIDYELIDQVVAEKFFLDAIQISDALWKENPNQLIFVKYSLLGRGRLASIYGRTGRLEEAEQILRKTMSILDAINHPDRHDPWFEIIEREPLQSLTETCVARGNWDEVAELARRSLEIDTRLFPLYPNNRTYLAGQCRSQIELLRAERNRGAVRNEADRLTEIERLLTECANYPDSAQYVRSLRAFLTDTSNTPLSLIQNP